MNHEFSRPRRTAVVLDPHPLCHMALSTLLGRIDIDLVGTATSTETALALLQEHRPDLLVLEVDLPEGREEALHLITSGPHDVPDLTTVVLSSVEERCTVDAAFDRGAAAYVLKSADPDMITTAIRQAFEPSLFLARPMPVSLAPETVAANGTTDGASNGRDRRQRRRDPEEADAARARDPAARLGRPLKPPGRPDPLGRRPDGEVPPRERVPQARRPQPLRGGEVGSRERDPRRGRRLRGGDLDGRAEDERDRLDVAAPAAPAEAAAEQP